MERAKGETKNTLEKTMSSTGIGHDDKIKQILSIYNELEIDRLTNEKMEEYYNKSLLCWENLNVPNNKKQKLLLLANKMMNRTS